MLQLYEAVLDVLASLCYRLEPLDKEILGNYKMATFPAQEKTQKPISKSHLRVERECHASVCRVS